MPRCFVMQPFDGGEFDKQFDEIYKLAIEEAGFEPYRVDRDPGASVPIENIESGIRGSVACFADITIDNPNVWFELGYAICANKPLCLICGHERERFPFDIQHRKIIRYKRGSPSDFDALRRNIVDRLKAIQEKNATIEVIIKEPDSAHQGEIGPLEFSALCVIFENQQSDEDDVSAWSIVNDMERVGYTKLATRIALTKLVRVDMISVRSIQEQHDEGSYYAYKVSDVGANYILNNVGKLELRRKSKAAELSVKLAKAVQAAPKGIIDNDIPF